METLHYDAFISYRHTEKDIAVAKELQQSLERFRIPKSIRQAYGMEKISRIFRDQEDLEMTSDLSRKIDEALDASDYLIVVCSPQYVQSKWCIHELETFVEKRGADRVLCVLSDGEPPAIFPDILKTRQETVTLDDGSVGTITVGTEPLACDYRGDFRQARRIELPRLAAAIIGCGYDELMMRQERYLRRRRAAIFSGVFLAASIAISYLLWSNAKISSNFRQSQINESKMLAREAMNALGDSDRLSALNSSLEAVGNGAEDRPTVDEAVNALTEASYAYTLPGYYIENWRIDTVNDIVSFCLSEDGKYLTLLDRAGAYRVIDMAEKKEVLLYTADPGSGRSEPVTGRGHRSYVCAGGTVAALEADKGKTLWELPLKYMLSNALSVSPDGTKIAAADSYAVQIMTENGEPFMSLPLPEDEKGYVTDLFYSKDGSEIGVILRAYPEERVAVFDEETGRLSAVSEFSGRILFASFLDDGRLYVLSLDGAIPAQSSSDLTRSSYTLDCALGGERIWTASFEAPPGIGFGHVDLIAAQDGQNVLVSLGDSVYRLSGDGNILDRYGIGTGIASIPGSFSDHIDILTENGILGSLYPEYSAYFETAEFPSGVEEVRFMGGDIGGSYVVLKSGNLSVYSMLYDEGASYWPGEGFLSTPLSCLRDGDILLAFADNAFIFYDINTGETIRKTSLSPCAYHPLTARNGTAYALRVDPDSAAFTLLSFDMFTGEQLSETALPVTEFYTSFGVLRGVDAYNASVFIDTDLIAPSPVAVRGSLLCMHDWDALNSILIYDLSDGSMRRVDAVPEGSALLQVSSGSIGPSPLLISDDLEHVFSVYSDPGTEELRAVLISLADGSVRELDRDITDFTSPVFADGLLLYAGKDALHVLDGSGSFLYDIPFTGDNAVSFSAHDGKVYCVFPDSTLEIYEEGKLRRKISLSFGIGELINGKMFRYEFSGNRLYLYRDRDLDVIRLDTDSATPLFSVPHRAIDAVPETGKIICYGPSIRQDGQNFGMVSFTEYSLQELIARSREQIGSFLLKQD